MTLTLAACGPSLAERAYDAADQERYAEAEALYRECEPTPLILNNLGATVHMQGRLEEAEALYRQALERGHTPARHRIGIVLLDRDLPEDALAYLAPSVYRASALSTLGRHEEAAELLGTLVDYDDPMTLYNWAAARQDAGQPCEAIIRLAIDAAEPDEEWLSDAWTVLARETNDPADLARAAELTR